MYSETNCISICSYICFLIESACCLRRRKRKAVAGSLPVISIGFYRLIATAIQKKISQFTNTQFKVMAKAYC